MKILKIQQSLDFSTELIEMQFLKGPKLNFHRENMEEINMMEDLVRNRSKVNFPCGLNV